MPNDLAELYDEWLNDLAREKTPLAKILKLMTKFGPDLRAI